MHTLVSAGSKHPSIPKQVMQTDKVITRDHMEGLKTFAVIVNLVFWPQTVPIPYPHRATGVPELFCAL